MKKNCKKILVMLIMLIVLTMPAQIHASSTKTKALKAYGKMLTKSKIGRRNWKSSGCDFALVYFDNNSVPELVVRSYESGMRNGYYEIFTYKNGKVKSLYDDLGVGFEYYKKKSVFRDVSYFTAPMGGPGNSTIYYKIKNGAISSRLTCTVYEPNPKYNRKKTTYKYYYNGKKISKSKYKSKLKSFTSNKKVVSSSSIKFRDNTKKNRKQYLKYSK